MHYKVPICNLSISDVKNARIVRCVRYLNDYFMNHKIATTKLLTFIAGSRKGIEYRNVGVQLLIFTLI
jgi:hypothetical protein